MRQKKEILKKIRRYEIKIRNAVNTNLQGSFSSVFKGNGLEFDDIRQYQYGDDIRTINWNVTAKGHGAFVNTYKEDKSQNIFLLVDISASGKIGRKNATKLELAKEVASVLAFSATYEQSDIGLLSFSDQKERFLKPGKGDKQAFTIFNTLFTYKPKSNKTDLKKAFESARNLIRRKSVMIIISDFIDDGYHESLKALSHNHDVILIHIVDKQERKLPRIGISPLWDLEAKKIVWKNTLSQSFRKTYENDFKKINTELFEMTRKHKMSYVKLETNKDYVGDLIQLFKFRNISSKK